MPLFVGIAGPSCSGKTSLCENLAPRLDAEHICLDDFYVEREEFPGMDGWKNFDAPESLRFDELVEVMERLRSGEEAEVPVYDIDELSRTGTRTAEPSDIVLVEGFLLFCDERVMEVLDLRIFIDIGLDEQRRRREEAHDYPIEYFDEVAVPMFEKHGEPTRRNADIVLDGTADIGELAEKAAGMVRTAASQKLK